MRTVALGKTNQEGRKKTIGQESLTVIELGQEVFSKELLH